MVILKCCRCEGTNLHYLDYENNEVWCDDCKSNMDIDMECELEEATS